MEKKYSLTIFFFLLSSACFGADWTGFKGCGLYQLKGVVRTLKDAPTIIVNEETLSEMRFSFSDNDLENFKLFENAEVEADVYLNEPMKGSNGVATIHMPNILDPNDTGMSFISNSKCSK